MKQRGINCQHCGTANTVCICEQCEKPFVLTAARLNGQLRAFESEPVASIDVEVPALCDFCAAKVAGVSAMERVSAGMRQRTCLKCHTEFLTEHGL